MVGASTVSGSSYFDRSRVSYVRTYNWPPIALNVWIVTMLAAASSIIGIFASFIEIQSQLDLPIPWYFPYYITVGCQSVIYIIVIFVLIAQRRLLPAIVMIGAFMLFVLWMVGLVAVSIQLFGSGGSVQSNCNLYVWNQSPKGQSLQTLAWLQQKSICQSWYAVFAMGMVGCIFLLWIMVIAWKVFVES